MKMAELVESVDDVLKNILTLDNYGSGGSDERRFHAGRIKNGKLFVAVKANGHYLFAPSKFAGYKDNNTSHEDDLDNRDGGVTNRRFDELLGQPYDKGSATYQKIDSAFLEYCNAFGIVPSKHHRARRYWVIEGSSLDRANPHAGDDFEQAVRRARSDPAGRRARLKVAPKKPTVQYSLTKTFVRNPDVVAEALERADGYCEGCNGAAPFRKASDGSPYLEVHHKITLADDGDDTVENAIALCPNCHRQAHYGITE
jgi:5-methylcytosine-specific restriction endonuclease McrA